jgi:hypothetical protein
LGAVVDDHSRGNKTQAAGSLTRPEPAHSCSSRQLTTSQRESIRHRQSFSVKSRAIDFIDEGDSEVGPTDVRFSLRISEENVTSHAKDTETFAARLT